MEGIKKAFLLLLVAILGGLISVGAYKIFDDDKSAHQQQLPTRPASYNISNVTVPTFNFADVADAVMPTVVHITTVTNPSTAQKSPQAIDPFDFFGDPFGSPMPRGPMTATGSGVILSSDGYIVTNNHVAGDANEITVVLYDKRSYKADLVGKDPNTDLALLKIEAEGLSPVKLGSSDDLRVGEWVLAVGNPFNLTSTVTAGIVSAKGRNINLLGGNTSIESFIQTDAAVNPGNSGGALVNAAGELIGINTAIASQTGQYAGYSFAVPVSIMKKVVDDFREFGTVQRGYIGVQIQDVNAALAKEKGLDRPVGVLVQEITDKSAAADAGIKKGDVILEVDGRTIHSVPELLEIVGRHRPGDKVGMTVWRDEKKKEFELVLRNKEGKTAMVVSSSKEMRNKLGAKFETLSDEDRSKFKISNGVKVTAIEKGAFSKAGVPEGFVITNIDKEKVYTPANVYAALNDKEGAILVEGYTPSGEKKYYVLEMPSGK